MKYLIALALLLSTFIVAPRAASADAPVVTGARIEAPDHLTVGDRFRIIIDVEADDITELGLAPDSLPPTITIATQPQSDGRSIGNGRVAVTMTLEVAAFAPGAIDIPPIKIIYRNTPTGDPEGTIVTPPTQINIESVIDPTSPDLTPRDLKPQADIGTPGSSLLVPILVGALIAVALIVFIFWRIRASRPVIIAEPIPQPVVLGPEDRARAVLDRAGGEFAAQRDFERYYATLAVAVRVYLTERFGFPAFALTTTELQEQMQRRGVDRWQARITSGLLQQCDSVVYASYRPALERADADLTAAYEIVEMSRPDERLHADVEEEAPV